jgi:hypothetical protein
MSKELRASQFAAGRTGSGPQAMLKSVKAVPPPFCGQTLGIGGIGLAAE